MEYPYPYAESSSISFLTIALHVALLIAALTPIILLFWQVRRAARVSDFWIFLGCIIVAPVVLIVLLENVNEHSRPFVVGYFIFFEVVSVSALLVVQHRLRTFGKATPTISILAWLLFGGLLIAMFLPAVPTAREAARRTQCMNHLKQLGFGLHNYLDIHRQFPFPIRGSESQVPVSWRVVLTPFMELERVSQAYRYDQPWDSQDNAKLAKESMYGFSCPSWKNQDGGPNKDESGNALTAFSIPLGKGTFFGDGQTPRRLDDAISTSTTILMVESTGQNIIWSQPRDVNVEELPIGINLPGKQPGWSHGIMSSHHPKYAQVTMLDGSVTGFVEGTDPEYLKALLSGEADAATLDAMEVR